MTAITVRDVPDGTRDELAARAARAGQSLQEYLRGELIELARRPDARALVAEIRSRKALMASGITVAQILTHRDAERR
jgi:plasmid stability protein